MPHSFMSTQGVPYQIKHGMDDAEAVTDFRQTANCFNAYEVNPAIGCGFGCRYCSMYAQTELERHMPVVIYKDYPKHLAEFIQQQPNPDKLVFNVSPKTDFFSSELIESGVTAELLEVFHDTGAHFYSLTKAGLPPRDIQDLLVEARANSQIIISSGLPSPEMEACLEPGAAPTAERLEFAKFCQQNEIPVTGIIAPYLPLVDDDESYRRSTLERFKNVGIDHCSVHVLKASGPCLQRMIDLMPEHRAQLHALYFQPEHEAGSTIDWRLPGGETVTRSYAAEDYMRDTLLGFKRLAKELSMTVTTCVDVCRLIGVTDYNKDALRSGYTCVGYIRPLAISTRSP